MRTGASAYALIMSTPPSRSARMPTTHSVHRRYDHTTLLSKLNFERPLVPCFCNALPMLLPVVASRVIQIASQSAILIYLAGGHMLIWHLTHMQARRGHAMLVVVEYTCDLTLDSTIVRSVLSALGTHHRLYLASGHRCTADKKDRRVVLNGGTLGTL